MSKHPSSVLGCSDTSSISDSVYSNDTLPYPTSILEPQLETDPRYSVASEPSHNRNMLKTAGIIPTAPFAVDSVKKTSFECPFCSEIQLIVCLSRKYEFKRHLKTFHQNDAQWFCPERDCAMAFDWEQALRKHMKQVHKTTRRSATDDDMVELCPQLVFTCGFSNCQFVMEAPSINEIDKTRKKYFDHIISHLEAGHEHRSYWSYSTRFRNLMRQEGVEPYWKSGNEELQWQPQTSNTLRKMLETRHLSNIPLMVQWAADLGSVSFTSGSVELSTELQLPVKDKCKMIATPETAVYHHETEPIVGLHPMTLSAGLGGAQLGDTSGTQYTNPFPAMDSSSNIKEHPSLLSPVSFSYSPFPSAQQNNPTPKFGPETTDDIFGNTSTLPRNHQLGFQVYSPGLSPQHPFMSNVSYTEGSPGFFPVTPTHQGHEGFIVGPSGYLGTVLSPQMGSTTENSLEDEHEDEEHH